MKCDSVLEPLTYLGGVLGNTMYPCILTLGHAGQHYHESHWSSGRQWPDRSKGARRTGGAR